MKRLFKIIISVLIAAIICAAALPALLCFTHPMDERTYNLSMFAEDGESKTEDKGWTVFINNQGQIKELTPDGTGGFTGLDYAGQTFYFSRTMEEELDSPTLRIGVANRTVSVFLDDTLIYTDCPDADNRIGYVSLPMLEFDRAEPVIISLPSDYHGKKLTVAQSSPVIGENQNYPQKVYPSEVSLYCGYSYESALIADASETAIPAALLFALGILMLAAFVWSAFEGAFIVSLPVIALTALLGMCEILASAPFFYKYFGGPFKTDLTELFFYLSIGMLLIFFTIKARRKRWILLMAALVQICSTAVGVLTECGLIVEYSQLYVNLVFLPMNISLIALPTALIYSFFHMRNAFHRYMSQTALGLIVCSAVFLLLCVVFAPERFDSVIRNAIEGVQLFVPKFILRPVWGLCFISGIIAQTAELLQNEIRRRSEASILAVKNELAMKSCENIKRQSDEIMAIRHDTQKHYAALRAMLDKAPERAVGYLDTLIGELSQIRPVINSGCEVLDILINGKLSAAKDMGIRLDIVRAQAPKTLPVSDSDLCSLIVNILDNAINSASDPKTSEPYICLDLHCKNNYFVFSCENSAPVQEKECKKISMPEHGYGLKIIRHIMRKYGDMVSVKRGVDTFKISVAILLNQSDK
ncbi:MAG: GHKL domain-containing protein [Clostridiales bacterium]|nr:GHKL domain-containing protein [Clostridiales bacterium]